MLVSDTSVCLTVALRGGSDCTVGRAGPAVFGADSLGMSVAAVARLITHPKVGLM